MFLVISKEMNETYGSLVVTIGSCDVIACFMRTVTWATMHYRREYTKYSQMVGTVQ